MTEASNVDTTRKISALDYNLRSLLAGGIAGGVAKTSLAPFERVRILFQVQHKEFARFSGSLKGALYAADHIIRTQGFKALYRGHSLSLARAVPHAAVGFTAYEHAKAIIMPTPAHNTPSRRFAAGAVAGLAALPITYPFELVRVIMATETGLPGQPRSTPFTAIRMLWSSSTTANNSIASHIKAFYRGFPVTALGSVPYRGGIFLAWETLHTSARQKFGEDVYQANRKKLDFALGAVAGGFAQAATYPLEIIRRRQQVSDGLGVKDVVKKVWQGSGWRGFYVGLGLGLVKQVPINAISLATWQGVKRALGIADGRGKTR